MFSIKFIFFVLPAIVFAHAYTNISIDALTQNKGVLFENLKDNDYFGNSVSRAGDFNADGYNDIIIGSKGANASKGIVYVIFGTKDGPLDLTISSGLTPSQALLIYPPSIQQMQLGYAVSYAGDINDDGIDDIMISAYGYQNLKGLVYVLYGSNNLPAVIHLDDGVDITQGFTILGISLSDLLGVSLGYAGDVNNDQIDDIIIGASGVADRTGAAYIIFGVKGTRPNITLTSSGLGPTEGFVVLGASSFHSLGVSVSRGGDLNGDGIDDVIIGANGVNTFFGAAYIIFGKKKDVIRQTVDLSQGLDPAEGITLTSGTASSYLGSAVAGIGDFNGDGSNDILLGAYRQSASKGAVYVIFGGKGMTDVNVDSGLDPTKGFKITGTKSGDYFGNFLSDTGDYNGDGLNDILIGAHQSNGNTGAAYVIFGNNKPASDIFLIDGLSSQQGFAFTSTFPYDLLGCAVSNAGDMNQDGMDDLLISTYRGMVRPGTTYLFYTPLVCPNTCLTCTKRSVCGTCQPGYALINSMCVSCPSGTKLVNGVCQPASSPLTTATEVSQGLFNSGSTASRIFTMGRSLSVGLGLTVSLSQKKIFIEQKIDLFILSDSSFATFEEV